MEVKIKLGEREYTLKRAMKNMKAIEDNLNHGLVYISRQVLMMNLKQSELAQLFSAGLMGSADFLEAEQVEKLMYETEGVTPMYYANIAVEYLEQVFTAPESFKKKAPKEISK
jgi:uncharacterized protein YqgQ